MPPPFMQIFSNLKKRRSLSVKATVNFARYSGKVGAFFVRLLPVHVQHPQLKIDSA